MKYEMLGGGGGARKVIIYDRKIIIEKLAKREKNDINTDD